MKSRYYILSSALLLCMMSCGQKTATSEVIKEKQITEKPTVTPGAFIHAVYFCLVDPSKDTTTKAFEKSLVHFISNSSDITSYHLGRPADTSRPIIDTSYTYCLLVTFDSKVEHDRYQEDPAHKQFIKESEHLWTRVQIYDSMSVL